MDFDQRYKDFDAHLTAQMGLLFRKVPLAREFHEGRFTEREYYCRHMLEAVLRIRMNNALDAYALSKIADTDNRVSGILAVYLADEFIHDQMLIPDLYALGKTREEIEGTEPMFSTQVLMSYLRFSVDRDGVLPDILWNWFVEWYSGRYNPVITARAREEFGLACTAATESHLQIDAEGKHLDHMSRALECLIQTDSEAVLAKNYLRQIVALVSMYFEELHELTGKNR